MTQKHFSWIDWRLTEMRVCQKKKLTGNQDMIQVEIDPRCWHLPGVIAEIVQHHHASVLLTQRVVIPADGWREWANRRRRGIFSLLWKVFRVAEGGNYVAVGRFLILEQNVELTCFVNFRWTFRRDLKSGKFSVLHAGVALFSRLSFCLFFLSSRWCKSLLWLELKVTSRNPPVIHQIWHFRDF